LQATLNIEYIKKVYVKYLEYQANGEEKEAMLMEKVLYSVLKVNEQDLKHIERAKQKSQSGWLSYFYSQ